VLAVVVVLGLFLPLVLPLLTTAAAAAPKGAAVPSAGTAGRVSAASELPPAVHAQ